MKLLLPTSLSLRVEQLEGFNVTLCLYDVTRTIPNQHLDADAMVCWQNSTVNLRDAAIRMKNLRWIQSLAAGPNDVLNAGFDISRVCITTGSGLHDQTVAEHTVGLLLNAARRFFEMYYYQLQSRWPGHLGGAQPDRPAGRFTSLRGARVLIWGYGNIAKTLTPTLKTLGAVVHGVARNGGVRDGVQVFADDKLLQLLPNTDVLILILPGSDSTRHALNKECLAALPKHAWVVNVGRGSTIDSDALCNALEKGEIGGAALDVFETEPLPESSKLWKAPNTIISPHAAGGRPQGAEKLIADNLRRFKAKQQLRNLI